MRRPAASINGRLKVVRKNSALGFYGFPLYNAPYRTSTTMTAKAQPTQTDDNACDWCTKGFKARRGGTRQRFCSARCRSALWSALRRCGERALAAGTLSIDAVRNGRMEVCTLGGREKTPPPYPETGVGIQASPELLRRFIVEVPQGLLTTLVFRLFEIRFSEQDDLSAILAALTRLRHKPKISETSDGVKVLTFPERIAV